MIVFTNVAQILKGRNAMHAKDRIIVALDVDNLGKEKVLQFSRDAKLASWDGVIYSPQELELLGKQKELDNFMKVTPGVRPEWAVTGDQKRIMTPTEVIKAGATALVIGRPITKPPTEISSPVDATKRIAEEISNVLL